MTLQHTSNDNSQQQEPALEARKADERIDGAWNSVLAAMVRDIHHHNSQVPQAAQLSTVVGDDDREMRDASADDLIAWADDLDARVLSRAADDFRCAIHDYLWARGDAQIEC